MNRQTGLLNRRRFLATLPLAGLSGPGVSAPGLSGRALGGRLSGQIPDRLNSFASLLPLSLMPGFDPAPPAAMIAGKLLQGLIRLSDTLQPLPELATSWSLDPDGRACVFNLRDGVVFHDGSAFTAEDVVASIHYHQRHAAIPGFRWITGMKVLDSLRIRLSSEIRFDHLLPILDGFYAPILSRRTETGEDSMPVGTGPFLPPAIKFSQGAPSDGAIRLAANPHYWRPNEPRLREIIYWLDPTPDGRARAMRGGRAQLAQWQDLAPADIQAMAASPFWQVTEQGWQVAAPVCQLRLNTALKPLADQRVRQAISIAIDRDDLVQRVWSGQGRATAGPLPAFLSIATPPVPSRDLALASRLLEEAGCTTDDQGVRLHLPVLTLPWGGGAWDATLRSIALSLGQIGISVQIIGVSRQEWSAKLSDPTIGAALICPPSGASALQGLTACAAPDNILLQTAQNAAPGEPHRQAIAALERLLSAQCPCIWLFEPRWQTICATGLRNVTAFGGGVFSPFDYVFFQN